MIIFFAATAHAQEAEESRPVRIARVPIIFQRAIPDDKTCAALETKIERAIHIPRNGYLQVAEYLPQEETARALNDIWNKIRAADKKSKLADAMRPLAEKIDADIIVCPVLTNYYQTIIGFAGWSGDEYMDSYAAVELIVYDRRSDDLRDEKTSRMHHDTMSALGTAPYLAADCFDRAIAQAKLRELIRGIGR